MHTNTRPTVSAVGPCITRCISVPHLQDVLDTELGCGAVASLPGEETPICASRHEKGAILAKDYHLHAISVAPQLINLSIPGYLAANSTQDFAHIT